MVFQKDWNGNRMLKKKNCRISVEVPIVSIVCNYYFGGSVFTVSKMAGSFPEFHLVKFPQVAYEGHFPDDQR